MPLNTIINLSQNQEKQHIPIYIDMFNSDTNFIENIIEINNLCHDLNTCTTAYLFIRRNDIDINVMDMLNNQFGKLLNINILDYKGLTNNGIRQIALENIWDSITNTLSSIWKYIQECLTNLWNNIKSFFESKNDERTVKVMKRLSNAFSDNYDTFGMEDIPLRNVPNEEQFRIRLMFYIDMLSEIERIHNDLRNNSSFKTTEIYEDIEKVLNKVDPNKKSHIEINIAAKKITINKLVFSNGLLKEFNWLLNNDQLVDIQKQLLTLKKEYDNIESVINEIISVCKKQIDGLKGNKSQPSDKDLQDKVVSYSVLTNIISNIVPAFIKDSMVITDVCEQIYKKIEEHKNINNVHTRTTIK